MFEIQQRQSKLVAAFMMMQVIYHATARSVRKTHANAFAALLINMFQVMVLVATFYVMFGILGLRGSALRGDFLVYIMSGIFIFMTNTKTLGAVVGSEGPASPMMQHAPMNTFVAIVSAALGALYIQLFSVFVVLFIYHVAVTPVEIDQPVATFSMVLLGWFNGASLGLIFLALKPWFPQFTSVASTVYSRANMIASGKMFVANTLPFYVLVFFSWNPLFHIIDQARGFAFINYNPHHSSWMYPLLISVAFTLIGFMGESYTRKHASISWDARR